jgi:hypothetical protein
LTVILFLNDRRTIVEKKMIEELFCSVRSGDVVSTKNGIRVELLVFLLMEEIFRIASFQKVGKYTLNDCIAYLSHIE